jgi:acyl carrier protein
MTTSTGVAFVLDFLRSRRPDLVDLDHDFDLIDSRIINSLMFVEFLYRLEEATGQEIPLERVSPDDFRTINRIKTRFFDE